MNLQVEKYNASDLDQLRNDLGEYISQDMKNDFIGNEQDLIDTEEGCNQIIDMLRNDIDFYKIFIAKNFSPEDNDFGKERMEEAKRLIRELLKLHYHDQSELHESFDDARNDAESICRFLDKHNFMNYELYDYDTYPMDTSMVMFEVKGDWKHDHWLFKDLINDWAAENGKNIFKIDTAEVGNSDSDYYTAQYHIYIAKDNDSLNTLHSMRRLFDDEDEYNESLNEELWDRSRVVDLVGYYLDKYPYAEEDAIVKAVKRQMKKEGSVLPSDDKEFMNAYYSAVDYWQNDNDKTYDDLYDESLNEGLSRLEIMRENKAIYSRIESAIIKMSNGLKKLVLTYYALPWCKNNSWMGGMSDSKSQVVIDKLVKLGYNEDEIIDEMDNFTKCFDPYGSSLSEDEKLRAYLEESLTEDTIKTKDGKWTNKGKEGTHGKFNTKKEADAQRRAMFAGGFKEALEEEKEIKRYSDAYSDEDRQRGWWYFTTHGVMPGSIPKDLHVLEVRYGKNDKGTMGTFVRLDGILNTSELKYYDMVELVPTEEIEVTESLNEDDVYKTLAKLSNRLEVISYPYGYAITDGFTNDRLTVSNGDFKVDDGRFNLSDKDKDKIRSLIKKGIIKEALNECDYGRLGFEDMYLVCWDDRLGDYHEAKVKAAYPQEAIDKVSKRKNVYKIIDCKKVDMFISPARIRKAEVVESLKESSYSLDYDYRTYQEYLSYNFDGYYGDYTDELMKELGKCAKALRTTANKLIFYTDYDEKYWFLYEIGELLLHIDRDYDLYQVYNSDIKFVYNYPTFIFKNQAEADEVMGLFEDYAQTLDENLVLEGLVDISDDFELARRNWKKLNLNISFDDAIEQWNNESELADPDWYAKPLYSAAAWDDMVNMFKNK